MSGECNYCGIMGHTEVDCPDRRKDAQKHSGYVSIREKQFQQMLKDVELLKERVDKLESKI